MHTSFSQRPTGESLKNRKKKLECKTVFSSFNIPDTCYLHQADRDIRIRNIVRRHGNSYKTTAKQHIRKKQKKNQINSV